MEISFSRRRGEFRAIADERADCRCASPILVGAERNGRKANCETNNRIDCKILIIGTRWQERVGDRQEFGALRLAARRAKSEMARRIRPGIVGGRQGKLQFILVENLNSKICNKKSTRLAAQCASADAVQGHCGHAE